MDHASLAGIFQRSACIKLMQANLAIFIIGFLHRMFKEPLRTDVPLETLELELEAELADHSIGSAPDQPVPERSAQAYLHEWADDQHRFIRIVHPLDQTPEYVQLTAETEKVMGWLADLHDQPFVGTESRLLSLMRDLQDLTIGATDDPRARLAHLATERARIDAEIAAIEASGRVTALTQRQIAERFRLIHTHARELLSDFRLVEEKIAETGNVVQDAQARGGMAKAAYVEVWVDAETAIRATPQGESYIAFHQYLSAQRQEMQRQLDAVHTITTAMPEARKADEVWHLPHLLLDESHRVTLTISRVAQQIRQVVAEREERRALYDVIANIKRALQRERTSLSDTLPVTVTSLPVVHLPLERTPWQLPQRARTPLAPPAAEVKVADPLAWAELLPPEGVEQDDLLDTIERVLARQTEASLADVLAEHPAHYGFEELIAYCLIAHNDPRHDLMLHDRTTVFASLDGVVAVYTLPALRFRRTLPLPTQEEAQ